MSHNNNTAPFKINIMRKIENFIFDTIIYLGAFVLTFAFLQLMAHADKWIGL